MDRYVDRPRNRGVSYAARYEPGGDVDDLVAVAEMMDVDAEVVEVSELRVLVVRYRYVPDDHPSRTKYEVVEAGSFLAYSTFDFLYVSDAETFAEEHERG